MSRVIAFDIDGKYAEEYFNSIIKKLDDSEIENAIRNTMQTKTGSGNGIHIILRYIPEEYATKDVLKSKKLWIGKEKHSEISLKAEYSYLIVPPSISAKGIRYEFIRDSDPVTISKEKLSKLLCAFNTCSNKKKPFYKEKDNKPNNKNSSQATTKVPSEEFKVLSDKQKESLIQELKGLYIEGHRDDIIFGLSGMLLKKMYSLDSIQVFVNKLCEIYKDEEIDQRIRVVDETYQKWVNNEEVTGIKYLFEIFAIRFGSQEDAVSLIRRLSTILGGGKDLGIYHDFELDLPANILEAISYHTYKIVSIGHFKKLIIAHSGLKQTVVAFINKNPIEKKEQQQDVDNDINDEKVSEYKLNFGDILIDAIPTKVKIYDNPIDKSRKYEIEFSSAYEKNL